MFQRPRRGQIAITPGETRGKSTNKPIALQLIQVNSTPIPLLERNLRTYIIIRMRMRLRRSRRKKKKGTEKTRKQKETFEV